MSKSRYVKTRNTYSRKRNPIIFMIAEGTNKTETIYFSALGRFSSKKIKFAQGNYTDPVNMVVALRDFINKNYFLKEIGDKAYCLVDADTNPIKNKQIEMADKIANESGIEVIVSAPCFEVWLICHYTLSTKKYYSSTDVVRELQKYMPAYKKSFLETYEIVSKFESNAVENAKFLENHCINCGHKRHTTEFSPSTEIYKIIMEVRQT